MVQAFTPLGKYNVDVQYSDTEMFVFDFSQSIFLPKLIFGFGENVRMRQHFVWFILILRKLYAKVYRYNSNKAFTHLHRCHRLRIKISTYIQI